MQSQAFGVLCCDPQVQEAVKQLQLPRAPHVVAPICETGSSGMALRYLDKLSVQQQGLREQQQKAGGWAAGWRGKQGAAPGTVAVLKPEFLIFRNITSAVVAQVRMRGCQTQAVRVSVKSLERLRVPQVCKTG